MNTIQLAKNITDRINNGDFIAGHAILIGRENDENLPNKILKEGLIVEDMTQGLSFTTRQFEANPEDCLENLQDLVKNSSGSIVIISIPKDLLLPYNPKYFTSYNNSSILLEPTGNESTHYKDIFGNPTKIALLPAIYILGYLNVQKDIFIPNSNYAFIKKNTNIVHLKAVLDERYEKIRKENNGVVKLSRTHQMNK